MCRRFVNSDVRAVGWVKLSEVVIILLVDGDL